MIEGWEWVEKWLLVARFVDCVSFFGSECSKEEAHVDEVELLIPDPFSGYVVYLENAVRWYELDQRVSFMIIIGICLFRKGGSEFFDHASLWMGSETIFIEIQVLEMHSICFA